MAEANHNGAGTTETTHRWFWPALRVVQQAELESWQSGAGGVIAGPPGVKCSSQLFNWSRLGLHVDEVD